MAWARLDDAFHDHPKVDGISLAAVGLYTLCLTWAHRHRRTAIIPGHISEARVAKVAGKQANKLASELVTAGLWELENDLGGYLIHDFTDYLPKERDPEERAEAGRKGGKRRWEGQGKPDSNLPSNLPSNNEVTDSSRASAPAFPTRTRPEVPTTDLTTFGPPSARTVIADWIGRQRRRPPDRVVGQCAKTVGELLEQDFAPEVVGRALDEMTTRSLNPATLPSLVHGLVNGGGRKSSTTDQRVGAALDLAARYEAEGR